MILQSGTTPRLRPHLKDALSKSPSVIYVFPRQATGAPDKVLADRPNDDVRLVPLNDPTEEFPWEEKEVQIFKTVVEEAAALVKAGDTVLFACVAGQNRSRAAAVCTAALAENVDASDLKRPSDEDCFAALIKAIASGDAELVKKCAPVKPVRTTRKRAAQ